MNHKSKVIKIAKALAKIMTSSKDVDVTIAGNCAWRTPNRINVPMGDFLNPEIVTMTHGYIDHELGHEKHTCHNAFVQFARQGNFHKHILNIIEDVRMEKAVGEEFPGAKRNLESLAKLAIKRELFAEPTSKASAIQLIQALCLYHGRYKVIQQECLKDYSNLAAELLSDVIGQEMVEDIVKLVEQTDKAKSTADAADIADAIVSRVQEELDKQKSKEEADDADSDDSDQGSDSDDEADNADSDGSSQGSDSDDEADNADSDGSGQGSDSDDEADNADSDGSGQGSDSDDEADNADSDGSGQGSDSDDEADNADSDGSGQGSDSDDEADNADSDGSGQGSDSDDEADNADSDDSDQGSNSTNEASNDDDSAGQPDNSPSRGDGKKLSELLDEIVNASEEDGLDDFHESVAKLLEEEAEESNERGDVCWDFPRPYTVSRLHSKGSDFNVSRAKAAGKRAFNALNRVLVDEVTNNPSHRNVGTRINQRRLAGVPAGNDRIFKRAVTKQDTSAAISFIIDASGSMGRIMATVNECAFALADGLQAPGIVTEALYFSAYGNDELYLAKGFDEKPSAKRFNVLEYGLTPTGEAMMGGLVRLATREEANKIMFVITDGDSDSPSAVAKAREFAQFSGVKVIPIGINTGFVHGFDKSEFKSISDVSELAGAVKHAIREKLFKA